MHPRGVETQVLDQLHLVAQRVGELTEAAVVERMRARAIYEEIVYRRLDPALLEWAGTGRLALRVYPVTPREDKRLLLGKLLRIDPLTQPATRTGDSGSGGERGDPPAAPPWVVQNLRIFRRATE